jgi:small subunit ribosomal protein S7
MPRRRSPEKRKVLPDPKYKDVVLAKFMNNLMKDGKNLSQKNLFMAHWTKSIKILKKTH